MLSNEGFQLADDLAMPTERKVVVDALLERGEPELLQPGSLAFGERLVAELTECGPAPEGQRLTERGGTVAAADGDQLFESRGVEVFWRHSDPIAGRFRQNVTRPEHLA